MFSCMCLVTRELVPWHFFNMGGLKLVIQLKGNVGKDGRTLLGQVYDESKKLSSGKNSQYLTLIA